MRLAALLALAGLATGCIARSPEIFHTPDRLDRWARVAAIPRGAEVRVWRRGSEDTEDGRFGRADDEGMEMVLEADEGTTAAFSRSLVTRVSIVSGRPYRRYLGNGLRTGLLFGVIMAGIGVAAGAGEVPFEFVAASFLGGGLYGSLTGAIAAGIAPGTTVVFEAPEDGEPPADPPQRR